MPPFRPTKKEFNASFLHFTIPKLQICKELPKSECDKPLRSIYLLLVASIGWLENCLNNAWMWENKISEETNRRYCLGLVTCQGFSKSRRLIDQVEQQLTTWLEAIMSADLPRETEYSVTIDRRPLPHPEVFSLNFHCLIVVHSIYGIWHATAQGQTPENAFANCFEMIKLGENAETPQHRFVQAAA